MNKHYLTSLILALVCLLIAFNVLFQFNNLSLPQLLFWGGIEFTLCVLAGGQRIRGNWEAEESR